MGILLSLVLEVEEKVGDMSGSYVADELDILDNRRADGLSIIMVIMSLGRETSLSTLLPEPAMEAGVY